MDVVKYVITCVDCSNVLQKPVMLPCGYSVCLKHLENLPDRLYFCKLCSQNHHIEDNYINVNKTLEILINANLENLNFGPVYKSAVGLCHDLDQTINELATLTHHPTLYIKQTIDHLKNRTELIREEHKLKIDEKAGQIIEQLDNYEKQCTINLDSDEFKNKLNEIDINISKIRGCLDEWQKTLNNFGSNETQWKSIVKTSDELNSRLKYKSCSLKKDLLDHKLENFFEIVVEFQKIKVASNIQIEKELPLNSYFWDYPDVKSSKIIDETMKRRLIELCEFSSNKKWWLTYQASEHGYFANHFHLRCDAISNTLTIIKSKSGYIFGGFTSVPWDKSNTYKADPNAFIFSMVNPQNQPVKLNIKISSNAIYCGEYFGPTFGTGFDLCINDNGKNFSNLGFTYPARFTSSSSEFHTHLTESEHFAVYEIEIYQIL